MGLRGCWEEAERVLDGDWWDFEKTRSNLWQLGGD